MKTPLRHNELPSIYLDADDRQASVQTGITSSGPMAAIVGFESPYHNQRSVVALLADSASGYDLLNNALNDSAANARRCLVPYRSYVNQA